MGTDSILAGQKARWYQACMGKLFLLGLLAGCLLSAGCTIGVPLWPLLLYQPPANTATNTCPVPLTLPVADQQVAGR